MRKITAIVLHYSATYPDQDFGVADIRKMHLARGFRDVGYHYVIKRDGTIQCGRPEGEVGAHVSGHNGDTLGICCIGGLERTTGANVGLDNRTDAQKQSTIRLVRELLARYPGAEVVGHRDLGATQCPGFDVRSWWRSMNEQPPSVAEEDPREPSEEMEARVAVLEAAVAALQAKA